MRASLLIQKAVFLALDGELSGPLYDEVPPEVDDTLYAVIGETTEVPDDTHSDQGTSETLMLHFWHYDDDVRESGPVKGMMAEADVLLHHRVLSLAGGGTVCLTREFAEVIKDESEPGETWRHGVARYRVRTLEAIP